MLKYPCNGRCVECGVDIIIGSHKKTRCADCQRKRAVVKQMEYRRRIPVKSRLLEKRICPCGKEFVATASNRLLCDDCVHLSSTKRKLLLKDFKREEINSDYADREIVCDAQPVSQGGFSPGVIIPAVEYEFMRKMKSLMPGSTVRNMKTGIIEKIGA